MGDIAGFVLNMPDSLALFVLGISMFAVTLLLRRAVDSAEVTEEKVEDIGVKTQ